MSRKKPKKTEPVIAAVGHDHAGETSDWGAKLVSPPPEAKEEPAKKKKSDAPSVMGFLSRVGGTPTLGKAPARGLLGKISAEDLRNVGRLPGDDAEVDNPPPAPAKPEVIAAPSVVAVDVGPEKPVATVAVAVSPQIVEVKAPSNETASERLRGLRHMTPARGSINDRKSHRYPFQVTVEYTTVGKSSSEVADNLSEKGLFIHTANPLDVGDPVMISFAVPDATFPLTFPARVKWVSAFGSLESPTPGMGIEFTALDDKKRRALDHIITRLRRSGAGGNGQ